MNIESSKPPIGFHIALGAFVTIGSVANIHNYFSLPESKGFSFFIYFIWILAHFAFLLRYLNENEEKRKECKKEYAGYYDILGDTLLPEKILHKIIYCCALGVFIFSAFIHQ